MSYIPTLEFLLVPDQSAACRVRRRLAEITARSGVLVGTFKGLLRRAARKYCVADTGVTEKEFRKVLLKQTDAFWSQSFEVAPDETAAAVKKALVTFISATDPHEPVALDSSGDFSGRVNVRIADLATLASSLHGRLPDDLERIRKLLRTDAAHVSERIRVFHVHGTPLVSRWQAAVIHKLNSDAGARHDRDFQHVLEQCLLPEPAADAETTLGTLQRLLFEDEDVRARNLVTNTQWVRVRDLYQEAEIAAGMVQTLLKRHPTLAPEDIGLLVPKRAAYRNAVRSVFCHAGFALSGLPEVRTKRDLGREVVYYFLHCQKPYPQAMARAAVLSSPLMPWPESQRILLAQQVMEGSTEVGLPQQHSDEAEAIAALLKLKVKRARDSSQQQEESEEAPDPRGGEPYAKTGERGAVKPAELLEQFLRALRCRRKDLPEHYDRAKASVELLQDMLQLAKDEGDDLRSDGGPDESLFKAVSPARLNDPPKTEYFKEGGITVWNEHHEPWRKVKHLFVFGFDESRYPGRFSLSPVFSDEEWRAISKCLRLPVALPSRELKERRCRFRRQLRAATDSVTFLLPHRNLSGDITAPSDSLIFARRLLCGDSPMSDLVIDLDDRSSQSRLRFLARAAEAQPSSLRMFRSSTKGLELGRDLLTAFGREKESQHESPSSLERMLVSPLAWLLVRLGAVPPTFWAPESVTVLLKGDIVHRVFSKVFFRLPPGRNLDQLSREVKSAFEGLVRLHAPFLLRESWQIERYSLERLAVQAACAWQGVLEALEAARPAVETSLAGNWQGMPVRGRADLVVEIEGGRRLIVDYKLSKSARRRKQMEKGYELQASIYRALQPVRTTGSASEPAADDSIMYFTLRDRVCLTDSSATASANIPGWDRVHPEFDDISVNAVGRVRALLEELRRGHVRLNSEGDWELLDKEWGIRPYALDTSPLIRLFVAPDEV